MIRIDRPDNPEPDPGAVGRFSVKRTNRTSKAVVVVVGAVAVAVAVVVVPVLRHGLISGCAAAVMMCAPISAFLS
jgi:hypothetical protein